METIGVSGEVKEVLEREKEMRGHTSYDSVVRELIMCRFYGNDFIEDLWDVALVESENYESTIQNMGLPADHVIEESTSDE